MPFRFKDTIIANLKERNFRRRACLSWAGINDNDGVRKNMFQLTEIGDVYRKDIRPYVESQDLRDFDVENIVVLWGKHTLHSH